MSNKGFKVISSNGKMIKNTKAKNLSNAPTIHIPLIKVICIVALIVIAINFISKYNHKDNTFLSGELDASQEVDSSKIVATQDDNIAATVNIKTYTSTNEYTASGVIWGINKNNELVILTAKHTFNHENAYNEVTFVDGNTYVPKDIYTSKTDDFAFATIDVNSISSNTLNVIKTVKYDSDVEFSYNDDVYVIGMHSKKGLLYYSGQIDSLDINSFFGKLDLSMYELSANFEVVSGTSGGGMYDKNGMLIGICSKGNERSTIFVPIYEIIDAYNKNFS